MARRLLRVAYLLRAFPRLSETFILAEILALRRRGVEVQVIALERIRGGPVHPEAAALLPEVAFVPTRFLPQRTGRRSSDGLHPAAVAAAAWVAPLLDQWGTRHLHAHFAGPAATMAWAASNHTGIPYSFTAHAKDIFPNRVDWSRVRRMARGARAVVTVCEFNRRFLEARLRGAPVRRIYNGVDLDWWRPVRTGRRPGHVVAVGRLVPKKGFHVLVEAMALLRDQGVAATCSIIGEGAERGRLARLIEERRLTARVRLTGGMTRARVRGILQRAQIAALPCVVEPDGNQDALPTTLLEAGACGLAAVATRVAGVPEIVRHGRTGLLVRPDDAHALARGLRRLIENPSLAHEFGRAARAHIALRFDARRSIDELIRVFDTPTVPVNDRRPKHRRRDHRPTRAAAASAVATTRPRP